MKKVVIIGGGISGLSSGIFSCQQGFETEIYEMNAMLGGECTGWNRKGYHIDNCIHWLTGCNSGEKINDLWKNLNVLTQNIELYREPYFYGLEMNGKKLYFWRDSERARNEFLNLAPEDKDEINLFFDCVKLAECIKPPCEKSPAHMNFIEFIKMGMTMKDAAKVSKEYGKITVSELAKRFKNPYIKAMMENYFNENFLAITLITSYAFFTSGSAAIPIGGSTGIIQRMKAKFETLGGRVHLSSKVVKIHKIKNITDYVELSSGEKVYADAFIWDADPWILFNEFLGMEYIDKNLKKMYDCPNGYVANSGYQAAFGINSDEELHLPSGSTIFPCKEYVVANRKHNFCGMRLYDYDDSLFPRDKRVIQCNILQYTDEYIYWKKLYDNREVYNNEKNRIALELQERLEKQYPQLKGKLVLLNTYSPVTFNRWCGAYNGGYMSFNALKGYKSLYVKSTIKGIKNLYLGSQWIQNSGGLPIAAAGGKFAVQQLKK